MHYPGLHLGNYYVQQLQKKRHVDFEGLRPRMIWTSPVDLYGLTFAAHHDPQSVPQAHEALYALLHEIKLLSLYPDKLNIVIFTEYCFLHPRIANCAKQCCADGSLSAQPMEDIDDSRFSVFDAQMGLHSFHIVECILNKLNPRRDAKPPGFALPIVPPASRRQSRKPHADNFYGILDPATALGLVHFDQTWDGDDYDNAKQEWLEHHVDWESSGWDEGEEGAIENGDPDFFGIEVATEIESEDDHD
ncbi:hypothetical protein GGF32_010088 [Allomyces javanicus]|nr:hypothetical protein GGF32_010088 [Allomyces javanicus]